MRTGTLERAGLGRRASPLDVASRAAGGFALAIRCIGERHARHALPACTSTPTDQHAHGGGAGKSPKGFRPAGRRSLKRQVRAPIKKRRGVGATITSHALHSCAPAPITAELLPPQMLYVHLYFGPSRVCAALRAVFAAVFEASNTAANTAVLSVAQSCISNCIRGPLIQLQIQPPVLGCWPTVDPLLGWLKCAPWTCHRAAAAANIMRWSAR